jgi:transcription elongation factor Elf1
VKFNCPYCNTKSVPRPEKDERYQTCSNCGKRPRVVKQMTVDKVLLIGYVKTAHKSTLETKSSWADAPLGKRLYVLG